MPFTTIKVIEGVFSDKQKTRMIENVTEAMNKGLTHSQFSNGRPQKFYNQPF
ncbi:MAG: tautomerase family protein [Candidatus Aminicenantes bacterium]|nr:tautomerase family protein [Candidatus Aminicenantes bacterium]